MDADGREWRVETVLDSEFAFIGGYSRLLLHGLLACAVPRRNDWRLLASSAQIESGWDSSSILPLLSANESRWTPTLSSSVRWRLASGLGLSYLMWRPPFIPPAAPPATRIGRFVWSCTLGLPMPLP